MGERKKEKRKKFKEKNENEGERKVLSEGKIRFQKISLLFDDCFSDESISKVLLLFKHRTTTHLE